MGESYLYVVLGLTRIQKKRPAGRSLRTRVAGRTLQGPNAGTARDKKGSKQVLRQNATSEKQSKNGLDGGTG